MADPKERQMTDKTKRKVVTPYQRLAEEFDKFKCKVALPRRKAMWHYAKSNLDNGWTLRELWERTAAAEQLGYDVVLLAKEDGLHVQYVEKRPTV